ncbi:O-antigen polysaccharide polymerase Wzy [Halanaerobium sp. MA284_MarDTE_T2]|jgi:oligosaccharide repeat unit polymerase|uniref:O-antigen polysaccharide polymerase Wzy n=1 Tax=Halanaerobium sp. MA284_MarDTE_T2 TaxID=2183913 RepID=UPI000E1AE5B7|nr:O-antigen polysaccharide polymerase Wzy [Halanaerobium sp. MA284_MarDTE_T2]RCW44767.1 oligosaccharide repeat unit polymerase [Halanaerobium sp. MA284_MarDTE_T2]
MKIKINKYLTLINFINIFILLLFIFQTRIEFVNEINKVELLKYELVFFSFFYFIQIVFYYKNLLHPYLGLYYSLLLFNFSRILVDLLGGVDFSKTVWFLQTNLSVSVQIQTLEVLGLGLTCLHIGYLLNLAFVYNKENRGIIKTNELILKIGYLFLILGIIGYLYESIIYFKFVTKNGYLSLFLGNKIKIPIIIRLLKNLFLVSYPLLMSNNIKKDKAKKITIIYLIGLSFSMLRGQRTQFFSGVLASLSMYHYIYRVKKTNFKYYVNVFLNSLVLIFIGDLISKFRENIYFFASNNNLFLTIRDFIYSQGVSINVLAFTIKYKEKFQINNLKYIIAPITDYFYILNYRIFESFSINFTPVQILDYSNRLAYNLSYYINPYLYKSGAGLGGNYLAEFYTYYGYKGVIIFSLFFGFFFSLLLKKAIRHRYGIYILYFILPHIFMSPRGNALGFFRYIWRMSFVYFLIIIFINFIKRNKVL